MTRAGEQRTVIRAAIEATADQKGVVTPDRVVEAARDEENPLHNEFEWDDSVAAHQHRLAVARSLIREIRYEVPNSSKRIITSISYVHRPGSVQSYIPLGRVARNKKLAREVMMAELQRCESAIIRAREVADVLSLRSELDDLLKELIVIRRKAAA